MIIDVIVLIFIILYLLFVTTLLSAITIGIVGYLYKIKDINKPKNIKFKLIKKDQSSPAENGTQSQSSPAENGTQLPKGQLATSIENGTNIDLIPTRATLKSAGFDLKSSENCVVPTRSHKAIKTGIIVNLPPHSYGRIASRSGLSLKHGIEVGAGVIDEDYQNEVMVILYNHSDTDFIVNENDRIAQLIVEGVIYPNVLLENREGKIESLKESCLKIVRTGGFGSTGF
jgi:dUTP pyrophosphatase